jgi:hypothetical protein
VTGKRSFGCVKRELIAGGGIRQLRASVGVEETSGNKVCAAAYESVGG